jgi:uncharacterized membrane protein
VAFFWALMWIAILALVWFGIRTWGQRHSAGTQTSASGDEALTILQRRLATGEMSVDEYHERVRALTGPPI